MKSKRTVEYRTDGDRQLTAGEIKAMLAEVPDGAKVSAIRTDTGTQRDPWPVLIGLRVVWEEKS